MTKTTDAASDARREHNGARVDAYDAARRLNTRLLRRFAVGVDDPDCSLDALRRRVDDANAVYALLDNLARELGEDA